MGARKLFAVPRAKRGPGPSDTDRWVESEGVHSLHAGGFTIRVYEQDLSWHSLIVRHVNGKEWHSKQSYLSADAAKRASLGALQFIRDRLYFL